MSGAVERELRAGLSLAEVLRDEGEGDRAQELLEPLYEEFDEGFETHDLQRAKAFLEEM